MQSEQAPLGHAFGHREAVLDRSPGAKAPGLLSAPPSGQPPARFRLGGDGRIAPL